jgi:hypothetical protein
MLRSRKAQSTLEYAVLILVVVMGLIAMQVYMKKAVQGRMKESTDRLGRQFLPEGDYEFAWKEASSGTTETHEQREQGTGMITTNITAGETVSRDEHEEWGTPPSGHSIP